MSDPFCFFFENFIFLWFVVYPASSRFFIAFQTSISRVFAALPLVTIIITSSQAGCLNSSVLSIRSWKTFGISAIQKRPVQTVVSSEFSACNRKYTLVSSLFVWFEFAVGVIEVKFDYQYFAFFFFWYFLDIISSIFGICAFRLIVASFFFLSPKRFLLTCLSLPLLLRGLRSNLRWFQLLFLDIRSLSISSDFRLPGLVSGLVLVLLFNVLC